MPGVGGGELILVAVIVLIVFGAGRLPDALGQLRRGVRALNEETPRDGGGREPPDAPPPATSSVDAPAGQAKPRTRVLAPRSGAVTAAASAGAVVLASLMFLVARGADQELPPFEAAAIRFAAAGLLFFAYVRLRGLALPRGRALAGAVVFGLTAFVGAYALLYRGLPAVPAGVGSVALALVPLVTLVLAALHGLERPLPRTLVGGGLTTAGIVVVVRDQLAADVPLLAALALLAGVVCAAESGIVVRHFPRSHPAATNAIAMPVGALALAALSVITREGWVVPTQSASIVATVSLVAGTVVLFTLVLYVLGRWTATAASFQFPLVVLVTVIAAAMLAGESVRPVVIAGAAAVASGTIVASGALGRRPRPSAR